MEHEIEDAVTEFIDRLILIAQHNEAYPEEVAEMATTLIIKKYSGLTRG